MHLYSLICAIFCIFALECHGLQYTFREETVQPYCGGRGSNQVNVTGSRNQRRDAEIIIAALKQDYFPCSGKIKTLIEHKNVRIDVQKSGAFDRDGKLWRNLQVQQNGNRRDGYPSTVATVLIECNKTFPIRLIRRAFVNSMTKCAMIWLSQ